MARKRQPSLQDPHGSYRPGAAGCVITLTNPADGALVNYDTFIGQLDETATVTVDGEPATVTADNGFTHVLGGLPQGVGNPSSPPDRAGNSSTLNV